MIGYKGFDKNFHCQGFQFKAGETYTLDGDIAICERGFHFCDIPLAVFKFYPPANRNRFALVEADGEIVSAGEHEHNFCTNKLKIIRELSLHELINCANKQRGKNLVSNTGDFSAASNTGDFSAASNTGDYSAASNTGDYSAASNTGVFSAASNTGNRSAASNTGDYSAASNTGDYSAASNTGDRSAASATGKESVAIATGKSGKAKGSLGCWLVLTERANNGGIVEVKAFKVDGDIIKPDTFYTLENGTPVVVQEAICFRRLDS